MPKAGSLTAASLDAAFFLTSVEYERIVASILARLRYLLNMMAIEEKFGRAAWSVVFFRCGGSIDCLSLELNWPLFVVHLK